MDEFYKIKDNTITLFVKAVPNSSKNEIVGLFEDALKIKIKAPAVENKANLELVKFLAKEIGVPKSSIELAAGATSKIKYVKVSDCPVDKFENFCATLNLNK